MHTHIPQHKRSFILRLHTVLLHFLCFIVFCCLSFSSSAPGSLQATRALMIVGIIVSIAGLGVACMGMKCTTCGGSDRLRKARIAMTGGIILLVGGEGAYQRT